MSTETPSANAPRKAWARRGYDDGAKDRPAGVEVARARGGEPAASAYLAGYRRGRRSRVESELEP